MITPATTAQYGMVARHTDDDGTIREMTLYRFNNGAYNLVLLTWTNLACEPAITRLGLSPTGFEMLRHVFNKSDDLANYPINR